MGSTVPESFQTFRVAVISAVFLHGIASDLLSLPRVGSSFRDLHLAITSIMVLTSQVWWNVKILFVPRIFISIHIWDQENYHNMDLCIHCIHCKTDLGQDSIDQQNFALSLAPEKFKQSPFSSGQLA